MAALSMTAAVVFSIPELRTAIFSHHSQLIARRRDEVLGAIPRPGVDGFIPRLSYLSYSGQRVYEYFAGTRLFLHSATNMMKLVGQLGLYEATWLDLLLSQPLSVRLWIVAHTSMERTRGRYRGLFEAHPKSGLAAGSAYEHPSANPAEMFYYLITQAGYPSNHELVPGDEHSRSSFLRDDQGRVYVLEILERPGKQFLLEAASRCPDILYANDSPFWPTYDVFDYNVSNSGPKIGAAILQSPPCALASWLSPGNKRQDELRRILEQARDLFSHLVILHKHGISIGKQTFDRDWGRSLAHNHWGGRQGGPWLLPAYLERTSDHAGRSARSGRYEESLPLAPPDAWPGAAEDLRGLPWSQYSAYFDPRVPGPKFYIQGLAQAEWTDEGFNERVAELRAAAAKARNTPRHWWTSAVLPHWEPKPLAKVIPAHRYHEDTIAAAEQILDCFMQGCGGVDNDPEEALKLLESQRPSTAYELTLASSVAVFHEPLDCGRSPLFLYCPKCAKGATQYLAHGGPGVKNSEGLCNRCQSTRLITAMPEAVRQLLLSILRPSYDSHGHMIVVTAQEALDVLESCLQTELPRLQKLYDGWARIRKRVARLESPRDFPLHDILADQSHQRWLMIENLRGRFLDENLGRPDLNKTRDFIRNELTAVQKKKRDELRVVCGDAVAALPTSNDGQARAVVNEEGKDSSRLRKRQRLPPLRRE